MVQTEKELTSTPLDVPEFYDLLAPDYDVMTGLEKRFVQEKPYFRLIVERYGIKTALDAGCGSGFHAMLLSELGVQVTALDASKEMLKRTRANARVRGVKIKTIEASFEDLGKAVNRNFGSVFVLGNSLPHLRRVEDLSRVLANFSARLEPNGALFTQTLNYDRIMATKDRLQNTKEVGDRTFVRFYDYDEAGILFNILTQTRLKSRVEEKLKTIRLRPILRNEFVELLLRNGFIDIKVFGGISLEPFDPMVSKDLVVLARKS